MSETPEKLIEKRDYTELPLDMTRDMTVLVATQNKGFIGSKVYYDEQGEPVQKPTFFGNTIQLTNVETGETFDLPIWRPSIQISLHPCRTYKELAERLSRVGAPCTEQWVKREIERIGVPIYFATRKGYWGFDDGKPDEWLAFKSFKSANSKEVKDFRIWCKRFNRWLESQKSKYRIVRSKTIYEQF